MKGRKKFLSSSFAAFCLLLHATGLVFAGQTPVVFKPKVVDGKNDLQAVLRSAPELESLLKHESVQEAELVVVNADAIDAKNTLISLQLPGGRVVEFKLYKFIDASASGVAHVEQGLLSKTTARAASYWVGDVPSDRKLKFPSPAEVDIDPANQIFLARREGAVRGNILLEGKHYQLEPIDGGNHVLIRRNDRLDTHCGVYIPPENAPALKKIPAASVENPASIKVGLVMSEAASLISHGNVTMAEMMLDYTADMNFMFERSGANVVFVPEYLAMTDIDSDKKGAEDISDALLEIRTETTAAGANILRERERYGLDMVVYATAWFPYDTATATYQAVERKNNAFMMWDWRESQIGGISCMGYMFGLASGYRGDPPGLKPYAHAYVVPLAESENGKGYAQSIMYGLNQKPCKSGNEEGTWCDYVYLFSNPRKEYKGETFGDFEVSDAVRRLNEQGPVIADFYP